MDDVIQISKGNLEKLDERLEKTEAIAGAAKQVEQLKAEVDIARNAYQAERQKWLDAGAPKMPGLDQKWLAVQRAYADAQTLLSELLSNMPDTTKVPSIAEAKLTVLLEALYCPGSVRDWLMCGNCENMFFDNNGLLEKGCPSCYQLRQILRSPDDLSLTTLVDQLAKNEARNAAYRDVLDRLARLGNEPIYGNSDGNRIAQDALLCADETAKALLADRKRLNLILEHGSITIHEEKNDNAPAFRVVALGNRYFIGGHYNSPREAIDAVAELNWIGAKDQISETKEK